MLFTKMGIIRARKALYERFRRKEITLSEYESFDKNLLDMVKDNTAFADHNIVIRETKKKEKPE